MMKLYSYKLKNERNLYFIKNKKLKTVIVWFIYHMPLDENASKNAMLSRILFRGSKSYATSREITRFLYGNYGAAAGMDINLKGEVYTFGMFANFVNDKLKIIDNNLTSNIMNFIKDILYNPLIESGQFKQDYFDTEKRNLISFIENKINNKDEYAFDRCIEIMCKNEPYGIDKLGTIDMIKSMDNKDLVQRYNEITGKMPLNIYIMGNLDDNDVREKIENTFQLNEGTGFEIKNAKASNKDVIDHIEEMDMSQGKLCLGFRTGIDLNHESFPGLVVMNKLFGGGPQSRLFTSIREQESLCYSIYSAIEKYKGLMFVSCGIDKDKREPVKSKIVDIFNDIKLGKFTDSEVKDAVVSSIHSLESIKDNNYMYISYIDGLNIYNTNYDIDKLIKRIEKVTKEDIMKSCSSINLDTIYFLGSR